MRELATTAGSMSGEELAKRRYRWKLFQIVFLLVYVGIVLDIVTTALGYLKSGSQYEQNPLGGSLIGSLGWPGLAALMTLLCLICYHSVRVVYARMSLRWTWLINGAMILIAAFRWLAVVTAVIYLLQPVHGG
jgi:NADH:ubiquinone oxidoreductase subunit 6 (subunit J)